MARLEATVRRALICCECLCVCGGISSGIEPAEATNQFISKKLASEHFEPSSDVV